MAAISRFQLMCRSLCVAFNSEAFSSYYVSMKYYVLLVVIIGLASVTNICAQEEGASTKVAGGGVLVKGWAGVVDPKEAQAGLKLENAKLAQESGKLHVTTGPATTYWN